jgi:oxygen-independent coproporphyrinogen-3 oxidase
LNYWQFGDYLGIGAGAHGKITVPAEAAIERRAKHRNPRTYVELAGSADAAIIERIDAPGEIVLEFMMNALRLPEGVTIACYEERTGQPLSAIEEPIEEARRRGWLAEDPGLLRPTAAGLQVLNALLALF